MRDSIPARLVRYCSTERRHDYLVQLSVIKKAVQEMQERLQVFGRKFVAPYLLHDSVMPFAINCVPSHCPGCLQITSAQ